MSSTKPSSKAKNYLLDASIGIHIAGDDILSFERKVATNPQGFVENIPFTLRAPVLETTEKQDESKKSSPLRPFSQNLNAERQAAQDKLLLGTMTRIEALTEGKISPEMLEKSLETRFTLRALSILHSTTYQWRELQHRLMILNTAGEPLTKEDGTAGTRAGGLCFHFLRHNGLDKKIDFREMAKELKTVFAVICARIEDSMHQHKMEVNSEAIALNLAPCIFQKYGGRLPSPEKIKTPRDAAVALCERVIPLSVDELQALHKDCVLQDASNRFVQNEIPETLREHILEHPLQSVYARNPSGGLILDESGKQIFNPDLPEKWHKESLLSEPHQVLAGMAEGPAKEETLALLNFLTVQRRLNIPLSASLETLVESFPELPGILHEAATYEKRRMAYEISKPAHSIAYRCGIASAGANAGLLSKPEMKKLSEIQESLLEGPLTSATYWDRAAVDKNYDQLGELQTIFYKSLEGLREIHRHQGFEPEKDGQGPETSHPSPTPLENTASLSLSGGPKIYPPALEPLTPNFQS
jgi:hypothetical protein